jgi:hypothetical protein
MPDVPEDPTLGGPCLDDPQCDDGFDCTADRCDVELARCRHEPSDATCDDGIYCNGVETCSVTFGCRPGAVVSCSDLITCTIDTCVEETQSCEHELRDADSDGDPTVDCTGGDCDDTNPLVSSEASERCANERDDDCDGKTDEADCVDPRHDSCGDALEIDATGSYEVALRGAELDYPVSCQSESNAGAFRDVVIAIIVPDGEERDVSVVAMTDPAVAGYWTYDAWRGCSWTETKGATSITPTSFVNKPSEDAYCVRGVVGEEPESASFARLGFNLGEPPPEKCVHDPLAEEEQGPPAVEALAEGIAVNVERRGANPDFPLRIELRGPVGHRESVVGQADRWCADISGTGGKVYVPYSEFTPRCWEETADLRGEPYDREPISAVAFLVPGAPMQTPFEFCVSGLAYGDSAEDAPDRPGDAEGKVVLAATDRCGSAADECALSVPSPEGTDVARLYVHGLGEGAYPIYLSTTTERTAFLRVDFRDPTPAPENETCGTAVPLTPAEPVRAVLANVATDIDSACPHETGDLVYSFELDEPSDVRISAVALDGYGWPVISLRREACTDLEDEITCRFGTPRELFARALPAGRYYAGLSGTGPTEAEIALEVSPPTDALPGEGCENAPELEFGRTEQVTLSNRPDAVQVGCVVGAPDAAFTLAIPEESDVLVVQRVAPDEVGGLLLADGSCSEPSDVLACTAFRGSTRAIARNVPEGTLRAVVESWAGKPSSVDAFRRPAAGSVLVARADECDDAVLIPEIGGRFEGTTRNAFADYSASCDYGGQAPGGAPDQMLKLELEKPRRMVFDMQESSYDTLLVLRDASGEDCPGSEIAGTCAPGYFVAERFEGRSFLDVTLPAGSYWVQIDGYDGAAGRWVLDVFSSAVD